MTPRRARFVLIATGLALLVVAVAGMAAALDPEVQAVRRGMAGAASGSASAADLDRRAPSPLPAVAELPCFGCHDPKAYREGERFPHASEDHEDIMGHCHLCHAFQGHFEIVTRKTACEECH